MVTDALTGVAMLFCLQVMVVVKYLFQFGFFPWNSVYEMTLNEDKPFFPPCILGLEKTDNYIKYDLLQLLALFFHRSLLMVSVTAVLQLWYRGNHMGITGHLYMLQLGQFPLAAQPLRTVWQNALQIQLMDTVHNGDRIHQSRLVI